MTQTVDARGLPCPQPVIMTRNALREGGDVTTIVDNDTARHNVTRMAERAGYTVQVEEREDGIYLHIGGAGSLQRKAAPQTAPAGVPSASDGWLVLVVPGEHMGRGEHAELGEILMRGFFHTLGEVELRPAVIIFFNRGVKLEVEGSTVVQDLQALRERGTEILACGTCLDYYGLKGQVAVGEVSNMYTIAETMLRAAKVLAL